MANPTVVVQWKPIEQLDVAASDTNGRLAAVEALRGAWAEQLGAMSEVERTRTRQRTLRRLAIETGILERLYDVEWGLTLTLVAEGFMRDVVERAGGSVDERTLATLNAQRDTLEMVIDFVRDDRELTPGFIRELHYAVTRTQTSYTATDALGRIVEAELPRGEWKRWSNHVDRPDGTRLEYCPPEQVASEVDNLITWYDQLEQQRIHPLVTAAWLHHRFVQIHPFADGNGRVARCLTLLVMQRHQLAPLVIDRFHRADYLAALDLANGGSLRPLVKLFAKLEEAALASELERPTDALATTSSLVAHTLAAQLSHRGTRERTARQTALAARCLVVFAVIERWLDAKQAELTSVFRDQGIDNARVDVFAARSDQPARAGETLEHLFFKRQVVDAADRAGHWADFDGFVGLLNLRVRVAGTKLAFVVSLHGAGVDSGAMAVTTLAVIWPRPDDPDAESAPRVDVPTTTDAFRFVYSEDIEAIHQRDGEFLELLDAGLTVALAELSRRV